MNGIEIDLGNLNTIADVDCGDESYEPDEIDLKIQRHFAKRDARIAKQVEAMDRGKVTVIVFDPLRREI